MKRIRISFEEENKETHYTFIGDLLFGDKKLLKKKINEIIEEVFEK